MRISDWSSDVCSSDLMRVLLVEDEREMAAWLERALAQSGFVPEHAPDARTAESLLAASEYDAVIMDLRLPDKHGLALLREMRNRGDVTPVLILTAQGALQRSEEHTSELQPLMSISYAVFCLTKKIQPQK